MPDPVEPLLDSGLFVIAPQPLGNLIHTPRHVEGTGIDQPVEQRGATRKIKRERRGVAQDIGQHAQQRRARLQQAEQVDRAGQPVNQPVEPVHRRDRIWRTGKGRNQLGEHSLERVLRCRTAQRARLPAAPAADALGNRHRIIESGSREHRFQRLLALRQRFGPARVEPVIEKPHRRHMRFEQAKQGRTILKAMQACHAIERFGLSGQGVGLLVIDHLEAVFDRPVEPVCIDQRPGIFSSNLPGGSQSRQRVDCRGRPQRGVPPAMNELVDLGKEFALANAAATAFQVEAGAERLPPGIMVPDPAGHATNLTDRTEIQPPTPDKWPYDVKKTLPQPDVTRTGPGPDERRPLPRQCARFIIGNGRIDRQRNRRHFGIGPQPQVNTEDIPVAVAGLHDLHHPRRNPHRRFGGFVPLPARQGFGVKDQDRINVRTVIQFLAAMFAKRDGRKSARLLSRSQGFDRGADRMIKGNIGKGR